MYSFVLDKKMLQLCIWHKTSQTQIAPWEGIWLLYKDDTQI